jgi:hypothetical protein
MYEQSNEKVLSIKQLKEFDGSLQEFADKVLSSKRASNEVKKLGNIDDVVKASMKQKNIELLSDEILITDKKILKYLNHPKEAKGAVINTNRYNEIEKAINNPQNIYEDLDSKTLVYIYTSGYDHKTLKLVIHPNYKMGGDTFNILKSIGLVENWNLNNPKKYLKIK